MSDQRARRGLAVFSIVFWVWLVFLTAPGTARAG
jgi:hypothetical protein